MVPLLLVSLILQLGAKLPARPVPVNISLETYRNEIGLLHHGVDRAALGVILVWDPANSGSPPPESISQDVFGDEKPAPRCGRTGKDLREARPGERVDDGTSLMILHLWATWCEPCKDELVMWSELGPRLVTQYKGRVR